MLKLRFLVTLLCLPAIILGLNSCSGLKTIGSSPAPRDSLNPAACSLDRNRLCTKTLNLKVPEIERRLSGGSLVAWKSGSDFLIAARSSAKIVETCCNIQVRLIPIPGTDLHAIRLRAPKIDEARFMMAFFEGENKETMRRNEARFRWSGIRASAPDAKTSLTKDDLKIQKRTVYSQSLMEFRDISVYIPDSSIETDGSQLPVVFMTDGHSILSYARIIERGIAEGRIEPIAIIAAHPGPSRDERNDKLMSISRNALRSQEYIFGFEQGELRFKMHLEFFLNELQSIAEQEYSISDKPSDRIVLGTSSGAMLAAYIGSAYGRDFDLALAYSIGRKELFPVSTTCTKIRLAAGYYEPLFQTRTQDMFGFLKTRCDDVRLSIKPAGHSTTLWGPEFERNLEDWTKYRGLTAKQDP